MLGFIFGFNARMGRLRFFLSTLALSVMMGVATVALVIFMFGYAPRVAVAVLRPEDILRSWPCLILIGVFMVLTFLLQSMRLRDIGWDPVIVVPAYIAMMLVDRSVAVRIPDLAAGPDHYGTAVGALINLALFALLVFMPSGDAADPEPPPPAFGDYQAQSPQPPRSTSPIPSAARIAQATRVDFGRR
jgi:hypothetical protein